MRLLKSGDFHFSVYEISSKTNHAVFVMVMLPDCLNTIDLRYIKYDIFMRLSITDIWVLSLCRSAATFCIPVPKLGAFF